MFDKSVYINRRKQLIDKMSGGLVLILGNEEAPANYPSNTYKFRQDSSFLYFFGLNMPGFAGLMDADSGDVRVNSWIPARRMASIFSSGSLLNRSVGI